MDRALGYGPRGWRFESSWKHHRKSGTIVDRMAKKQTRRSISISVKLYEHLRQHCDERNLSMSGFVEDRIREHLGMDKVTSRPRPSMRPPAPAREAIPEAPTPVPLRFTPEPGTRPAIPTTAAEARAFLEPPPLFLKKTVKDAPEPPKSDADKIFTF